VHEAVKPPIVVRGSNLDFDEPHDVSLPRRFFSYGGQDLSLDHDLLAEAYLNIGVLRLKGWNIELTSLSHQDLNLDREIIRSFLHFYGKAQAGTLSEAEREDWAEIVSQVDYQRFCAERAPAVYVEGTVLAREDDQWRVRWHDGTEQTVPASVGRPLEILDQGESFGAFVKFGKGRAVESLSCISFVSEPAGTSEELWDSWPAANS